MQELHTAMNLALHAKKKKVTARSLGQVLFTLMVQELMHPLPKRGARQVLHRTLRPDSGTLCLPGRAHVLHLAALLRVHLWSFYRETALVR